MKTGEMMLVSEGLEWCIRMESGHNECAIRVQKPMQNFLTAISLTILIIDYGTTRKSLL